MSNLLALDQSSKITGYAIFKDSELIELNHFEAKGDNLGNRLEFIRNKIIALINEYSIDEVVFEDIQLQDVNGSKEVGYKTFKILAQVLGVIQELLTELKIKYTIIPPIVWKASFSIAGKGRKQEKIMSQQYIKSTININCTEDEADAACIGLHHLKKQKSDFDWA